MNKKKKKKRNRATANIPVSSAFWPSRFPPLSGSPVGRPMSSKGLHGLFPWPEPLPASSPAPACSPPAHRGVTARASAPVGSHLPLPVSVAVLWDLKQ